MAAVAAALGSDFIRYNLPNPVQKLVGPSTAPGFALRPLDDPRALESEENQPARRRFSNVGLSASWAKGVAAFDISGGVGFVGYRDGKVLRWNLLTGASAAVRLGGSSPIDHNAASSRLIRDVFVSPQGLHALICCSDGETWYIHSRTSTATVLPKLKGLQISAVCWSRTVHVETTEDVLLGTKQGRLHLLSITNSKERISEPLLCLSPPSSVLRIISSEFLPAPTVSSPPAVSPPTTRYVSIIAATTNRLYHFQGLSYEHAIKSAADRSPPHSERTPVQHPGLVFECPCGSPYGEVVSAATAPHIGTAQGKGALSQTSQEEFVGWLNGSGVFLSIVTAKVAPRAPQSPKGQSATAISSSSAPDPPTVLFEISSPPLVVPFPPRTRLFESSSTATPSLLKSLPFKFAANDPTDITPNNKSPLSMALTDYHILLLFDDRLAVISRVSQKRVEETSLPPLRYGVPKRLIADLDRGTVYLQSDQQIFEVIPRDETAGLWSTFSEMGSFREALGHAKAEDQRELVICQSGNKLLKERKYVEAAEVFSESSLIPFEDVCFRFLAFGDPTALTALLSKRLNRFLAASSPVRTDKKPAAKQNSIPQASLITSHKAISESFTLATSLWMLVGVAQELHAVENQMSLLQLPHSKETISLSQPALTLQTAEDLNDKPLPQQNKGGGRRGGVGALNSLLASRKKLLSSMVGLLKFLTTYATLTPVVYEALQSIGRSHEAYLFAVMLNDVETLVTTDLCQQNYLGAIMKLVVPKRGHGSAVTQQDLTARLARLVARHGAEIFHAEPTRFAAIFLRPHLLSPQATQDVADYLTNSEISDYSFMILTLVPAVPIISWNQLYESEKKRRSSHTLEAIRLLEFLLFKSQCTTAAPSGGAASPQSQSNLWPSHGRVGRRRQLGAGRPKTWSGAGQALFNLLIFFLSLIGTADDVLRVLKALQRQIDAPDLFTALEYVARVGMIRPIVAILGLSGMRSEAVKVALKANDFELAKLAANQAPYGSHEKKQLWLEIAKAASMSKEPPYLLSLLADSQESLALHEVLQFVSGSSVIAAFKFEICRTLDAVEVRMKSKAKEMKDNRAAAESLKKALREKGAKRSAYITSNQRCDICQASAAPSRFYVFPCRHVAHAGCIHRLLWPHLTGEKREYYRRVVEELARLIRPSEPDINVTPIAGRRGGFRKKAPSTGKSLDAGEAATISHTTLQKLEETERLLDECLGEECPICGNLAVEAIGIPFLPQETLKGSLSGQLWTVGKGCLPGADDLEDLF